MSWGKERCRFLLVSLLLSMNLCILPASAQTNLLANPGFEDGLDHWTKVGAATRINILDEFVRTGVYAAEFASVTTAYTGRGLRSDPVPVTEGETYSFGVYGYAVPSVDPASSYWRFVQIEWRDEDGSIIGAVPGIGTRFDQFEVWEESSLEGTAPAGAETATLLIRVRRDTGTVTTDIYVDDAFIRGEVEHTLTVDIVGEGQVMVEGEPYTGPIAIPEGTTLALEAVPGTGWAFSHWEDDSTTAIREIQMTEDIEVTATFSSVYTITLAVEPAGGGMAAGDGAYPEETEVTVLAVPNECYVFDRWTEDGAQVHTEPAYTFPVERDRHLVAWFAPCPHGPCAPLVGSWDYESDTPLGGAIGQAVVGAGDAIYILRAHSTGAYQFWRYAPEDAMWTDLTLPFDPGVDRPKSGTAMAWGGGDAIYALMGGARTDVDRRLFYRYEIADDAWTRLADTPADQGAGNALTWSGYDMSLYAFLGSRDHGTAFARFDLASQAWEQLPTNPAWEGTDDGASLAWTGDEWIYALQGEWEDTFEPGEEPLRAFARFHIPTQVWQQLPDVPDPGGVADGASLLWIGEWVPERASCLFVLGGGSTYFEEPGSGFYVYDLTQGTWSPPAQLQLPCPVGSWTGNRLAYAADRVWYWQGAPSMWDCGGTRLYALQVTGAHTITATAGEGGSIAPAGDVTVAHGGSQAFTITPDEGYEIADVLVDGSSEGAVGSYTFTDVTRDHTIHATFRNLPQMTLTVEIVGDGKVWVDGAAYTVPVTVFRGTELDLEAVAAPASLFHGWEDGSAGLTRTIRIDDDTTVTATFRRAPECLAIGPHPVPAEGCVFWLSLSEDAVEATLTVYSADGVRLVRIELDPSAPRYPAVGRWEPRDDRGRLLGSGLYLVLVEMRCGDGTVSYCPLERMVIER